MSSPFYTNTETTLIGIHFRHVDLLNIFSKKQNHSKCSHHLQFGYILQKVSNLFYWNFDFDYVIFPDVDNLAQRKPGTDTTAKTRKPFVDKPVNSKSASINALKQKLAFTKEVNVSENQKTKLEDDLDANDFAFSHKDMDGMTKQYFIYHLFKLSSIFVWVYLQAIKIIVSNFYIFICYVSSSSIACWHVHYVWLERYEHVHMISSSL